MYDIKISQAQASIIAYDLYDVIVNARQYDSNTWSEQK